MWMEPNRKEKMLTIISHTYSDPIYVVSYEICFQTHSNESKELQTIIII